MLRIALRSLRRAPLFAFTATAALALGIGVNTAIFSALNAALFRPAFIDQPDKIAVIGADYRRRNVTAGPAATGELIDARAARHLFSHVGTLAWLDLSYTPSSGLPERIAAAAVSPGWFELFGARPLLGRTFQAEDETPGNHRVIVLSYGAWLRLFGGGHSAVGRGLNLDGETFSVVGVMPPEFRWPLSAEVWRPLVLPPAFLASQSRLASGYPLYARLREGVSRERAQTELQAMADRGYTRREAELAQESGRRVRVRSFVEAQTSNVQVQPAPLLGAVLFVLLVACANVAGMMLARGTSRAHEMSVRAALGANRWHLMQPLLLESACISLAGVAGGLAVGWTLLRLLVAWAPPEAIPPRFLNFDATVLAFTTGAGLAAGLSCGVLPAWQVSARILRPGRQWARSALVVAEVALALILLVGAGLFLRSLWNLQAVQPGFETRGLLTAELALPATGGSPDRDRQLYRAVLDRLREAPGIERAALASALPLLGYESRYGFTIPGRDLSSDPFFEFGQVQAMARRVSPDYFATLGVRITRGRAFLDTDSETSEAVMIVDDSFARRYFPGEDPAGRFVQLGRKPYRVVGVAAPVRQLVPGLAADQRPLFYLPLLADPVPSVAFLLRGSGDLARTLRENLREVDPRLVAFNAQPLEERVRVLLAPRRIAAWLLAFFAASALFLAGLGLYGVISYAVSQRTKEIGIRMALGSRPGDVARLVLAQGMRLALIGAALGLAGSLAISQVLSRQLFRVAPFDPAAFAVTTALLLCVAAAASWLPARRAASVDPLVALRRE